MYGMFIAYFICRCVGQVCPICLYPTAALMEYAAHIYLSVSFRMMTIPIFIKKVRQMKIENSSVNLSSSREYQEKDFCKTDFAIEWQTIFNQKLSDINIAERLHSEEFCEDSISLYKEKLLDRLEKMQVQRYSYMNPVSESFFNTQNIKNPIMDLILEKLILMDFIGFDNPEFNYTYQNINIETFQTGQENMTFDVKYRLYEEKYFSHYEHENTKLVSDGTVHTQDGKEINFALNLDMDREFLYEEKCAYVEEGTYKMIDPLIINYDGIMPELSDFKFNFDLNVDNEADEIFGLKPGSGFLAFDINSDGIINDGSELFGTTSGDGFSDLKQYDHDDNNWIDENDEIYGNLSLWNKDENGEDSLESIKDAGIGAIYLENTDTQFDLKDKDNTLLAKVEKSSVVLNEDGTAGTIQQIDYTA